MIREKQPLEWPVFQRALDTLVSLRGPDLLRIKGLLNLKGAKGPVVFQAVQHLIHPPVELAEWPDKDRSSRLVFITRDVSEQQVRDLLDSCKALGFVTGEIAPDPVSPLSQILWISLEPIQTDRGRSPDGPLHAQRERQDA